MSTPEVTVVVPTVDRVSLLGRCLRGLLAQEGIAFEILVVSDGNAGVADLCSSLASQGDLRLMVIPARGVSAKRNAGWRAARAHLIAFTDDDCEPAPGWLSALVAAQRAEAAALVAGPVLPHPQDAVPTGIWARTIESPTDAGLYPGCNLCFTRQALDGVGGFDPSLSGGEDTDLAWRVREAGGTAGWAPGALVWHAQREVSFTQHLRSLPRWAGLPLVVKRHPQLRSNTYRALWWKRTHPPALVALVGLLLLPRYRAAGLLLLPLVRRRTSAHGTRAGLALAVTDVAETAVLVAGSAWHRSVLL